MADSDDTNTGAGGKKTLTLKGGPSSGSRPGMSRPSRTVVVAYVPEPLTGGAIVKHMLENYNTAIAGARNKLTGRVVRIGTMGLISESDVLTDLYYLERSLVALGHPVPTPGCGVAAAVASLS